VSFGILLPLLAGCLPGRSSGERLYRRHCASCHGVYGGGGVRYQADDGANLLDDTWTYGSDPSEIEYSLVNEGVRGHTTWDFTNQERQQLVDHVLALRGESR
jgi:mono/diheme cytochrome c family protein